MIISYSHLYKWQTCQRAYYYNFELGLIPNDISDTIQTGIDGHKIIQVFYTALMNGYSKEAALEAAQDRANQMVMALFTKPFVPKVTALTAWTLIENYVKQTDFTAEVILVENRFIFPISQLTDDPFYKDLQIGFTPDVVFRRKGNFVDVEDSKFVQKAWPAGKLERFPQLKLYQIFLEEMGYNVSRSILRQFNVKTGKIIPKPYVLEPAERKIFISDLLRTIKEYVRYHEETPDKSKTPKTFNYNNCSYCLYKLPCDLEARGKDASRSINAFYSRNSYDYTR